MISSRRVSTTTPSLYRSPSSNPPFTDEHKQSTTEAAMVYWRWWCWRLKEYDDAISVVWRTIGVGSGIGVGVGV